MKFKPQPHFAESRRLRVGPFGAIGPLWSATSPAIAPLWVTPSAAIDRLWLVAFPAFVCVPAELRREMAGRLGRLYGVEALKSAKNFSDLSIKRLRRSGG